MHGQTIALARYFSELQSFSDLTVRFWEAAPWPSKNSVHHQTSSIAKGLTSLYTSLCNFPRVKTEPNPTFLALPNSPACQSCRARPIGAHALGARHAKASSWNTSSFIILSHDECGEVSKLMVINVINEWLIHLQYRPIYNVGGWLSRRLTISHHLWAVGWASLSRWPPHWHVDSVMLRNICYLLILILSHKLKYPLYYNVVLSIYL